MIIELPIFMLSAIVTWISGVILAKATDSLDCRYKLGDDFGGLVLLGIVGSLPDLAIALSAAINGHISVITGNLMGGVAIQTLVIVILDYINKGKRPLSYLAGSVMLSFEAIFVMIMVTIAIVATYVPPQSAVFNMNPVALVLPVIWIIGLHLLNKIHKIQRFNQTEGNDAHPGKLHDECRMSENSPFFTGKPNMYVISIFILASVLTLISGFCLERSCTAIAQAIGVSSGVFAATILALITSLPEISTGIEAVLMGDNHLAISDIWGGNAFMLIPFFLLDLIAGKPILSYAQDSDRLFALLGLILCGIYAVSFLAKPRHRYFRLGLDSILEICTYVLGVAVLYHLGWTG